MEIKWMLVMGVPFFSIWGGGVKYILSLGQLNASWCNKSFLKQVAVSGFTGCIAGLLCAEAESPLYVTLATSGLSATMGCSLLRKIQERIFTYLK